MLVSDVSSLFGFVDGLGTFLYGMNTMVGGIQKAANSRVGRFLGILTSNRFMMVYLGVLITAIIQNNGATAVMMIGFVGVGILSLIQAVGVITGANIDTIITAWIVPLSQLGGAMGVVKPVFHVPLLIGIGAMTILFSKKQKQHTIGEILVGLELLFIGLEFMSSSISPYTNALIFAKAFQMLGGNPLLGMVIGVLMTALLQSSSASIGILQTLAVNGVMTINVATYIMLEQNIGSCVMAVLSSAGDSRTARRVATMYLCFNIVDAVLLGVLESVLFLLRSDVAVSNINTMEISVFHIMSNLTSTALLFPFAKQLVKLSGVLVREKGENTEITEDDGETATLKYLDERIFESLAFAVGTATLEIIHMGQITLENVNRAINAIIAGNLDEIESMYRVGETTNNTEKMLTGHLIKIDDLSLTECQKPVVDDLLYSASDIERAGDHVENLAESAFYLAERELAFSDTDVEDLEAIGDMVLRSSGTVVEAHNIDNMSVVREVSQYEDEVDSLKEELREKHIERLSSRKYDPSSGIVFLDIVSNLERISDHVYDLMECIENET